MSKYSPEYMNHRNAESMSLNAVKQAIRMESILESRVKKCDSNNNLILDIGKNIIGIIKFEELEYHPDGTPIKEASATSKINKHVKYIPISIRKEEDVFIVECSRKQVQKICYDNYISKLTPGDVIDAYVLKIMNYGIFCDIGCGIVALLPTNNISVTHIINPTIELKGNSVLKVVVKNIDENYKIELTHRELLGTWEEEASEINEGEIIYGTVLSIEEYGVFVRISQNLSGLAGTTNIGIKVGDLVSARIQTIQNKNMKVKMTILEKVGTMEDIPMRFKYKIKDSHIKEWVYSTPTAKKRIESYF